jgi:hypothetical protein
MLTSRRSAQLGLGAACLLLVSSVAVLVAGAADSQKPNSTQPIVSPPAGIAVQNGPAVSIAGPQAFAMDVRR